MLDNMLVLLLSAGILCLADALDPILVALPQGQISGHYLTTPNDNVFYAFQEIPYAAPPIGELRFQAPVAPEKWDGILNTTENRKICYQTETYGDYSVFIQTEDCLYLNVYTPVTPGSSASMPVLVWIHGGAFTNGAGAYQMYKPELFIDFNVIVVTLNYRLGALGFLTTEDGVIPGNLGLKDQQFALQWVKENINLFGGDPEKITISGVSVGGASVGLQLISKRNKGLFRGAILQSGTPLCQWSHQNYARFYAFELGRSLDPNFTSDDSEDLLALLKNVSANDINNNTITVAPGKETGVVEGDGFIWVPVIEDENLDGALITGLFHEDIRTGNINQVPILIGFNSEEMLYFLRYGTPYMDQRAEYWDNDLSNVIRNKFNMTEANKLTAGSRIRQIYTDGLFEDDLGSVVKFMSDESFTTPPTRHAKLQSRYTDVYLYQFSYKGKMGGLMDVEVEGVRGVGHLEDLGYLWNVSLSRNATFDDPQDLITRQQLLTLWSNFVKYLNPTPEEDTSLGNVIWQKVAPNNLAYLDINDTLEMKVNPKEYLKWERIIDIYAIPPLVNY